MRFAHDQLTGCVAALAVVLALPGGAWGQFRAPPANGGVAPAARTQAVANAAAARGAATAIAYNPRYYGAGYPYAGGDPYGGYLNGGANVIQAQGQFMIQNQQALLT